MSAWTADELHRIGEAEELEVASYRSDGSLRPYVIIWVVRSGDDLYVRSALGPENGWFRRAKASRTGRVRAGGVGHYLHQQTRRQDDKEKSIHDRLLVSASPYLPV